MKGIFLAYYQFAVSSLSAPCSYPPDISTTITNNLLADNIANNLVHTWAGAQVQSDIASLVALRSTYPNVPINIAVNGGADGGYWHDAGSIYDADFAAAMATLRSAGIKIYGYIDPTVYTVNIASAKEKVDRWYTLYGSVLDGIFVDDYAVADYLPTWPYLSVAYYDELNQYIRAKRNPTIPATVPLICGNINLWQLGNRTSKNAAYFASVHAADIWLVAESTASSEAMNPAGVANSKKWILLNNKTSASMSDAQFNDLLSNADWVSISELSYATYQFLPNWLERQVSLMETLNGDGLPRTINNQPVQCLPITGDVAGQQLRIYDNGAVKYFPLVATNDPNASTIRYFDGTTTWAVASPTLSPANTTRSRSLSLGLRLGI